MAPPQRREALHREGRLELAVHAYKRGDFQSYKAIARAYDVSRDTLQHCLDGILPQLDSISNNRLLISTKEECLVQQILSMDRRGMPSTVGAVRVMASLLASQYSRIVSASKC